MSFRALFIAVALCLIPALAMSAPSVSGVSGTVTDGATINVTGSSFGTAPNSPEWLGANIENGTVGNLLSKAGWSNMNSWAPVVYANDQAHSGSKALKTIVDTSGNWNGLFTYTFASPIAPGETAYLTWWVRAGSSTAAGQWKLLRIAQDDSIVDGPQEYVMFNWNNANGSQRVIDPGTSNDQTHWSDNGIPRSDQTWQRVELILQASSINTYDGQSTLLRYTGSAIEYDTWSATRNFTGSGQEYVYASFQNYIGNGITGTIAFWFDDIYIQKGVSRVEICNSSTWSARGHCEIQPWSSWSDTSVAITVSTGTFTSGTTVYVYVCDSANSCDATGLSVVIGGGGSAPVISAVSCTPTSVQSPGAASCSVTASNSPTSYTWSGQGTNCSYSNATATPDLTCQYGGLRTPCVVATNASGSSNGGTPTCASNVVWRVRKPTDFTLH